MIHLNYTDIHKIESVMDKAYKDMAIELSVEPKIFDFEEFVKCTKLMEYRLSKAFEGATFNIQYKGNLIFDVYIRAPFVEGRYSYNADPISKTETRKYYDFKVDLKQGT